MTVDVEGLTPSRRQGDKRMARLDEKVALVTGAGRVSTRYGVRLAQEGAHVVAADMDRRLAEETAAQVRGWGARASSAGRCLTPD